MNLDQLSETEYDAGISRNFGVTQYLFAPLVEPQALMIFRSDSQRSIKYFIDSPYRRRFNYGVLKNFYRIELQNKNLYQKLYQRSLHHDGHVRAAEGNNKLHFYPVSNRYEQIHRQNQLESIHLIYTMHSSIY